MAVTIRTSKSAKVILAQTIARRLRELLDPKSKKFIDPASPIGDHIKGGAGAVRAFANVVNNSDQFSKDGVDLGPNAFQLVDTVADMINAIIAWYRDAGWTVTV